jgi:hypothetical protein
MTRGFINVMKSGNRAAKLEREANQTRDKGKTAVFMVIPQPPGYLFATGPVASRLLHGEA